MGARLLWARGPSRFSSSDIPQVLIEKTPVEVEKSQFLCGLGINQTRWPADDIIIVIISVFLRFPQHFFGGFVTLWPSALTFEWSSFSHNSYHLKARHDQTSQTTGFGFDNGGDVYENYEISVLKHLKLWQGRNNLIKHQLYKAEHQTLFSQKQFQYVSVTCNAVWICLHTGCSCRWLVATAFRSAKWPRTGRTGPKQTETHEFLLKSIGTGAQHKKIGFLEGRLLSRCLHEKTISYQATPGMSYLFSRFASEIPKNVRKLHVASPSPLLQNSRAGLNGGHEKYHPSQPVTWLVLLPCCGDRLSSGTVLMSTGQACKSSGMTGTSSTCIIIALARFLICTSSGTHSNWRGWLCLDLQQKTDPADCISLKRTSKAGVTPLMGAARGGHRKAVELFLQAGADRGARRDWETIGSIRKTYDLVVNTWLDFVGQGVARGGLDEVMPSVSHALEPTMAWSLSRDECQISQVSVDLSVCKIFVQVLQWMEKQLNSGRKIKAGFWAHAAW